MTNDPATKSDARGDVSLRFGEDDLRRLSEGRHYKLQSKLGAHLMTSAEGVAGCRFAVWAPSAKTVSVIGDFNDWKPGRDVLRQREPSGVWELFVPKVRKGALYKFQIVSNIDDYVVEKADPFGVRHEVSPQTASVVWNLDYQWDDEKWMKSRGERNALDAPMSIYELHLGSWRRLEDQDDRALSYREMAPALVEHVKPLGFTHVEFLPAMEHPFFGSWGYQLTGYFAPTNRYGTPQDFKFLIDYLHQHGIGVILDWVPSHFPTDEHGLGYFDGTHLFEYEDPREGFHPDWNSFIFNYARSEVRSFLISNALFWLDEYHADGLRVDAVASMLYRDYSRKEGEWIPNVHGGRENLEAIEFLKTLNAEVYSRHPDVQTIAEESTNWPMVSRPIEMGGLGFGLKWDMGWMFDTLRYIKHESADRRYHHHELVFRMHYAFNENFAMPLSHDEVSPGKGSLWDMMPGDDWQKFANLRLLYGYLYSMPGKKLLFMGDEFAQLKEWNHDASLQWDLLNKPEHASMLAWVSALNRCYTNEAALHELDCDRAGFEWIDSNASSESVFCYVRKGHSNSDLIAVVLNFTPNPHHDYRIGVPRGGHWREVLNSDAGEFGGSGVGNPGGVEATGEHWHGRPQSVSLSLPPLGVLFLKSDGA